MKAIVCVDLNWGIGYENALLYHIHNDMKMFKKITSGKFIVMGNKTYESLSNRPLPKRHNIVLSRKELKSDIPNLSYHTSIESVIEEYKDTDSLICIGGSSVYEQCMEYCDMVYVTRVLHTKENVDSYFPNLDNSKEWKITESSDILSEEDSNTKDIIYYQFMTYERVREND